jgi:hypothetical protein
MNTWRTVLSWEDEDSQRVREQEEREERRKTQEALLGEVLRGGTYENPNQDFSIVVSFPVKGRIERKRSFPDGSEELDIEWYPDMQNYEAQKLFDNNVLLPLKKALNLEGNTWYFGGSWTTKIGFPLALRKKGTVVFK